jgi:periplasmic divalent cation tolerance protein
VPADALFIYVTCPDAAHASDLGRALVDAKLAACVNIFPGMRTIYRWEGAVQSGDETAMIVKTLAVLFEPVAAFVRAHHPYDCPCIVALPIAEGDPDYLGWITASCAP